MTEEYEQIGDCTWQGDTKIEAPVGLRVPVEWGWKCR